MQPTQTRTPIEGGSPTGIRWEYRGEHGVFSFTVTDDGYAVLSIHTPEPNDFNDDHPANGCRSLPGQKAYCASLPDTAKEIYRRWRETDDDGVIWDALRSDYAAQAIGVRR